MINIIKDHDQGVKASRGASPLQREALGRADFQVSHSQTGSGDKPETMGNALSSYTSYFVPKKVISTAESWKIPLIEYTKRPSQQSIGN